MFIEIFPFEQQESEMNGVPSMTLPSISEDDENIAEDGETSPLSPPNRSPLHAGNSPRHAKFNPRYVKNIFIRKVCVLLPWDREKKLGYLKCRLWFL